ncbi:hypothetical protein SAMN04515666_103614 [Bosea lupini]|uniref:Uncharacterized protein n=1 Tax=Bosea lupini TaxID=1036779 RepID=A0A1H7PW05_9HYPH|nr:hypothetical protein [Bosea lupini]SEL39445.1 hypothetical protein SAMN04515666_103614 [Bosea lupini]
MSKQIEIEDAHGRRRTEPHGYKAKDGERVMTVRVPLVMMDGYPSPSIVNDGQPYGGKIGIGDAMTTDTVGGCVRVSFQDGTGALQRPDGSWVYTDGGGYIAKSHSREQQAHAARVAGKFGQWVDGYVDGKAQENVAYQGYVDSLNAWRNA